MLKPMSDTRRHAHELIDRMPEAQVSALVGLLETMVDPIDAALRDAPIENEEISEHEERAVAEARVWLKHNKPIPNEDVLADFGLTLEDFARMGRTPLPSEKNGTER
jgi:hypothetical protein